MANGRIIKALSGFYYVEAMGKVYQCKGRGVFRKKNITPLVGDIVTFDISGENEGYILEIQPRKMSFFGRRLLILIKQSLSILR